LALAAQADALAANMERALADVRKTVAGRGRPRTLLVFERDTASLQNMFASGGYGFLADLLDVAGGENVFGSVKKQAVQASTEMILASRPDVIIELRYGDNARNIDAARDLRTWGALGSIPAAATKDSHADRRPIRRYQAPRLPMRPANSGRTLHPSAPW
jgi:ABC-type Fe3+-hydroxamate transport system substrate-binding protein